MVYDELAEPDRKSLDYHTTWKALGPFRLWSSCDIVANAFLLPFDTSRQPATRYVIFVNRSTQLFVCKESRTTRD